MIDANTAMPNFNAAGMSKSKTGNEGQEEQELPPLLPITGSTRKRYRFAVHALAGYTGNATAESGLLMIGTRAVLGWFLGKID
ncbi:MAG: hypothetical protein OXC05_04020 [Halieaceae bacterium]|nr:hypothetical protein [Halieaceae bacterium]